MNDGLIGVRERTLARFAPPPTLTVSQFADRELVVATGPLAGARWRTDFAPYQRGIMDAFHEPGVEIVVVMGSAQWGKTSIAEKAVAYHIAQDPCPILVVEPTVTPMAEDFSKNRLAPMIEASPALRDKISEPRSVKDGTNTTLAKSFNGGFLAIGGANSAASLAARSIRLLVLDEVDRYPAELPGEGNPIEIAMKRTLTYRGRRRILMLSSPTLRGAPIDAWFQQGDRRRYHVPCPACEQLQVLQWANVKFTARDPETAQFACPFCGVLFGDRERIEILARGQWIPERPMRGGIASFHMWEGYSPFSSLAEMVGGFLRAHEARTAGDRSKIHTWINTTLGEPIDPDDGEGVESHVLLARREEYLARVGAEVRRVDVPAGACCLTLGIDVQDDRLEAVVVGWGPGEEAWIIDRHTLPGNTSLPEPWRQLDELLDAQYEHASGARVHALAACIDSAGHRTNEVYSYVERRAARKVFATIGRDGDRPIVSSPAPRKWGRNERPVPLYTIGVDTAKSLWMSRLKLSEKGPGFVHLPVLDLIDEEFCEQLTSERLVTRWTKGVPSTQWVKTRPRNEALDCAVLSLAALRLLNPRLDQMAAILAVTMATREGTDSPAPAPATNGIPRPTLPPRRVSHSTYLGGGR